jgi:hypothetical protein
MTRGSDMDPGRQIAALGRCGVRPHGRVRPHGKER